MKQFYVYVLAVAMALVVRKTWSIDCSTALQEVFPCQSYLIFGNPKPSPDCCKGVKDLSNIAESSKANFQTVCKCLKSAAQSLPINLVKAKQLPMLCNIRLNITIDPNIDCSKM